MGKQDRLHRLRGGVMKPTAAARSAALLRQLDASREQVRRDISTVPNGAVDVTDCLACGEPLAADLIADNIRRHIGCDAA
jgi:hypothetical protein